MIWTIDLFGSALRAVLNIVSGWVEPVLGIRFPNGSEAAPSISFKTDTDTGFRKSGSYVYFTMGGTDRIKFYTTYLDLEVTYAPRLNRSAGSSAAPSYTFKSDTNTGFYRSGTDSMKVTAGGVNVMRFWESGGTPRTTAYGHHIGTTQFLTSQTILGEQTVGGVVETNAYLFLADEQTKALSFTYAGWGFVQAGDNQEYALFTWTTFGVITLISNSANVSNADVVGNLCIFQNAPLNGFDIKNRLGADLVVKYSLKF